MGLKTTVQNHTTLFEALELLYPQSPKTRLKKMLQHNRVFCNGNLVSLHSLKLKPGDVVEVKSNAGVVYKDSAPFSVLFEDQDVIVVEKPVGIVTSSTDQSPGVYFILSQYLKTHSKGQIKAHVVHRLDKEVSGVLVFAKSEQAMNAIKDRWSETKKLYYALVEGKPHKPEGTIESWLTEDKAYKVHSSRYKSDNAKFAITHYKTLKTFDNHTLLEIHLDTGRKNQIRVHMFDMGCPIVGDRKYGASAAFVRRIRLHACFISFPHPFKEEVVTVSSNMPKDFLVVSDTNELYK